MKSEEGGDDVKSSWPLCPGLHTYYNGRYKELRTRESKPTSKTGPSSDCSLQLDCMKVGIAIVIADQHAAVNTFPGLVHTARHTMGVRCSRSGLLTRKGGKPQGVTGDWGEVVTR